MDDFGNAMLLICTIAFGVSIVGGFALILMAYMSRQRMRELTLRERIAMIEKGLVPPPEVDPARFERVVGPPPRAMSIKAQRYRSAGVMLMGFGAAIVMLLTFAAGVPEVGVGVGGGLAALGAAVFFNGVLLSRERVQPFPGPSIGPASGESPRDAGQ